MNETHIVMKTRDATHCIALSGTCRYSTMAMSAITSGNRLMDDP